MTLSLHPFIIRLLFPSARVRSTDDRRTGARPTDRAPYRSNSDRTTPSGRRIHRCQSVRERGTARPARRRSRSSRRSRGRTTSEQSADRAFLPVTETPVVRRDDTDSRPGPAFWGQRQRDSVDHHRCFNSVHHAGSTTPRSRRVRSLQALVLGESHLSITMGL